jgi:phenylalanyl-tRNA synthetase alpha chain
MKKALLAFKKTFDIALMQSNTVEELEKVRVLFLGRHGQLASYMKQLGGLTLEEKQEFGPLFNTIKIEMGQAFTARENILHQALEANEQERLKKFDVTLYRDMVISPGTLHLYSQVVTQLEDIFISMGYQIADGPEVDTGYYNFEALNVPEDHPARDMQDTFWLTLQGFLLRTQTSNVQIHTMQNQKPPLAVFSTGRVFRNEATDASHEFMFMQGESLFIDQGVSVGHLLAIAKTFLQAFFEKKDLSIRVRPGYFPFVEPGLEIDASCPFCHEGCSICKYTRWIELLGAGLVHPAVLKAGNIDPEVYSGFAFGFGIDRLAMIKYRVNDVRLFRSTRIPFLMQFR